MKLRLVFFAAFLSLVSCSSDNSPQPVEEQWPQEPAVIKYLDRIVVGNSSLSDETGKTIMTFGDNNKLIKSEGISVNNQVLYHVEYEYTPNGSLSTETFYNSQNVLHTQVSVVYDNQGRIAQKENVFEHITLGWQTYITLYSYEGTQIVASGYESADLETPFVVFTYSLNQDGKIFKIERDNEAAPIQEIVYDGGNIASLTTNGVLNSFEYTTEMPVYGGFNKMYENQFAGHTNNMILYQDKIYLEGIQPYKRVATANYISALNAGEDDSFTYEYVFDEDGYPVERTKYWHMVGAVFTNIEYKN